MQRIVLILIHAAMILVAGISYGPSPVLAQTAQDQKWCLDYTGDGDRVIRGCSTFIRSGLSVNKVRMPHSVMWSFFELRSAGYTTKGEYDLAISDLNRAIELSPKKQAELYNARGLNYSSKGELDRALADFTEAERLDPKYAYQRKKLERWLHYLKEIQAEGDYVNWSGPPSDASRGGQ